MSGNFSTDAILAALGLIAADSTTDFTRCERPNGTFYGTGGTCRKGSPAPDKGISQTPRPDWADAHKKNQASAEAAEVKQRMRDLAEWEKKNKKKVNDDIRKAVEEGKFWLRP